jgi:hypothetical protein
MDGRKAVPKLSTPPWRLVGQIVMKLGRFWFSVPSP